METILEVPEIGFETAQKIIQQQLVLILHAHSCQQREVDHYHETPLALKKCELPFCAKTKKSLNHIRECFEPETCTVSHCHATREIIRHWKTCLKKSSCSICKPIFKSQIQNLRRTS